MGVKKMCRVMALTGGIVATATLAVAGQPKYVFFFLGDGMSTSQVQATEAYLTAQNGDDFNAAADLLKPQNRLNMTQMEVAGLQTTYDAHALITDSASSATAFACGLKTLSGVIGMDETKSTSYKSIAQLAHESGKKVGILSSVSLDHATPAAYYASVDSRNDYRGIDEQLIATGYEFFGGGGLKKMTADEVETNSDYTVLNDRQSILALKDQPMDQVICINPWLQDSDAMPYAIDRPATNLSLAEMTGVAIANLSAEPDARDWRNDRDTNRGKGKSWGKWKKSNRGHDRDNGFFIMVEGGKIDWACHANDAKAAIGDVIDFDNAIEVAQNFCSDKGDDCLIVVTGDHETGGMTVGHATTGYTGHYDRLLPQTNSFTSFAANQWAEHKSSPAANVCGGHLGSNNLAANSEMIQMMEDVFGLRYDGLNDYQKEKLEAAYDKSLCGSNDNSQAENDLLYGYYEPIIVTITHILNETASIGWTSYSHTGVPTAVYAQGDGAELFSGFYDNTDIAKKLAKVMGFGASALPAVK
ncbi:MAG: alkaline phosphatase [Desulfopila sp.]